MQNQSCLTSILSVAFLLLGYVTTAQTGMLSGRVSNIAGLPVYGATITAATGQKSSLSDSLGAYQLILPAGNQTIVVTASGYTSQILEVNIRESKITIANIELETEPKLLEQVVIQMPAKMGSLNSMLRHQKNTASIAQVLSAETMSKTPDSHTGGALKRVTGLALQEDKYLNVRGLGDRYNQTMLNGMLLSSTEPDRKTFSFDLFPTAIVDYIIVEKTFLPEYTGEWAGGLVIIETKDIPQQNFSNLKAGTGFNSQTPGKPFYIPAQKRHNLLGFNNRSGNLPTGMPSRNNFATLSPTKKNEWGKQIAGGSWNFSKGGAASAINKSLEVNGGFTGKFLKKEAGGIFTLIYSNRRASIQYANRFYNISNEKADESFDYQNHKSSQTALLSALANFTVRLHKNHKLHFRNQFNTNTLTNTTLRQGRDYEANSITGEPVKALEYGLKTTTFSTSQISGEHLLPLAIGKLEWYGSFGIMDQNTPNQRRIQYNDGNRSGTWLALLSNTLSQKTGSVFFSHLNDHIFNTGIKYKQDIQINSVKQTVKAGYQLQVKDRIYASRPFGIRIPRGNPALLQKDPEDLFSPEHFNESNGFQFDELSGLYYQYTANSLLNAGFIQFENKLLRIFTAAWGVRFEHFDQIVGSKDPKDPRYSHRVTGDWLPAVNIAARVNSNTNIRIAASKTVIRPEFRELTGLAFYDFELGATVVGNPNLHSTNVLNLDLRYEIYPRAGEVITAGAFYKSFQHPIELAYNQTGAGSSSTFNYVDNERSTATVYGMEFEIRKNLGFISSLKNFTVHANFSRLISRVQFEAQSLNRSMQGQSPYLINAGLQYESNDAQWSGSILFNEFGRRIIYVGNETVPAIWEAPRPLLDMQFAKTILGERGSITINITDLLSHTARFYHDLNKDKKFTNRDALVIERQQGTGVGISFNYQIK